MNCDSFPLFGGAYAIGSLSGADRTAYEEHLETCDTCLRQVAQARDSVQLLNLAPVPSFEPQGKALQHADVTPGTPTIAQDSTLVQRHEQKFPEDLLVNLLTEVRRSRHRRRLNRALIGATAACLLAFGALTGISHYRTPASPVAAVPAVSVSTSVLNANLRITTRDTWQEVNLVCTYTSPKFTGDNYRAIAMDQSGHQQVVGTWPAIPGQTATMSTPTTFRTLTTQTKITSVIIVDSAGVTLAQLDV